MILRLKEPVQSEQCKVTVKRDPSTRKRWLDHFDAGHRVVTVADPQGTGPAILAKRPSEEGANLTLEIRPLRVVEVWGGVAGELSSLFIQTESGCVYGERINGWKFKPCDTPKAAFQLPTPIAAEVSRHYIEANGSP